MLLVLGAPAKREGMRGVVVVGQAKRDRSIMITFPYVPQGILWSTKACDHHVISGAESSYSYSVPDLIAT